MQIYPGIILGQDLSISVQVDSAMQNDSRNPLTITCKEPSTFECSDYFIQIFSIIQ